MANPWFRVWTDMINDPKWRTIARASKQRIGDVISVYMHMLTCASNADERGRTEGWSDEDVATALDIETSDVGAIREAMQGRVLDGDHLMGWEKRQPLREDGAAERAKAWRERQKEDAKTQANASERNQSLDTDKIREEENNKKQKHSASPADENFEIAWSAYPKRPGASKKASLKAWSARIKAGAKPDEIIAGVRRYAAYVEVVRTAPEFIKQPATFFGPNEHYLADWTVFPRGAPPGNFKFDPVAHVNRNKVQQNANSDSNVIDGQIFEVVPPAGDPRRAFDDGSPLQPS